MTIPQKDWSCEYQISHFLSFPAAIGESLFRLSFLYLSLDYGWGYFGFFSFPAGGAAEDIGLEVATAVIQAVLVAALEDLAAV